MKRSEAVDAIADALAKAQGAMGGASKLSANPFYKSKYADLASVWNACRKALADNNLAIVQTPRVSVISNEAQSLSEAIKGGSIPPAVTVTTLLMHNSGQWIEEDLTMWPRENTPQGIGSCISYCRRYALAAMVGVYQEDDDAERAHGRHDDTETGHASLHDEAELQAQLHALVNAVTAGDAPGARQIWNEANAVGTTPALWRALTTKQKKAVRDMLQTTQAQQAPAEVTGNEAP